MRSPYNYLITPEEGRSTSVTSVEGNELILNTDMSNHQYVSRSGIVLEEPIVGASKIRKGDNVIVHHNVFRRFYNVRGEEKDSSSYYKEDQFFCYHDQIFLYKREGSDWMAPEGVCFVKPLKSNDDFSLDKEHALRGVVKYEDGSLEEAGIVKGDVVGFAPDSEYEFVIDGQRLYRVHTASISIKYEREGNEREYNQSWTQSN